MPNKLTMNRITIQVACSNKYQAASRILIGIMRRVLYIFLVFTGSMNSLENTTRVELDSSARRAYVNPYHPEDDNIEDALTEEDGDNLHGLRFGQLSDPETKVIEVKRLKVNGRFFEIKNSYKNHSYEERL